MCRFSVATTLVLIWMISLASLLPTCLYQHMEVLAVGDVIIYELCVEKWPSAKMQKIYTILLAALQFALPVIVLSIIHIKISMYLNVHLSTAKPTNDFSKRGNFSFTVARPLFCNYYVSKYIFKFSMNIAIDDVSDSVTQSGVSLGLFKILVANIEQLKK